MMYERWLIRASQWARKPPSWGRVVMLLAVIVLCLLLFGFDHFWGWPTWLTVNRPLRMR
jgi:hypothetical protein